MAEIKLTKNELRAQQVRLAQLLKYLPTLHLKKAMLQAEVNEVRVTIKNLEEAYEARRAEVSDASLILSENTGLNFTHAAQIQEIKKRYENIAGVDIPLFEGVTFTAFDYPLFTTPAWVDGAVVELRALALSKAKMLVEVEKKEALERELREISIRVNLFEKNLIPKSEENIKKIRVFLGDQELAAVGQAKVAKKKIEHKKRGHES